VIFHENRKREKVSSLDLGIFFRSCTSSLRFPFFHEVGLMKENKRQAAVFLDRDGTINEEIGYMDRLEKLRLIPGAAEAIRLINESGLKTVVVTNQSGVARGMFDEGLVHQVNARLREMLRAEGAAIDGIYFCPHHPTAGREDYLRACDCRKPAPGLLLRAAEDLQIDLARSYMVGDTIKDIEAGTRAGAKGILVRTGLGTEAEEELAGIGAGENQEETAARPIHIAVDLLAAVKWLLEDRNT
jgi:D,D-heptose 1,7-bisphosphate phosphatase